MSNSVESLVESAYEFDDECFEHELAEGDVEIELDGQSYEGTGAVVLRTAPQPRVVFQGNILKLPASSSWAVAFGQIEVSRFSFRGMQIEGFHGGFSDSSAPDSTCVLWHPASEPVTGMGDNAIMMRRVVFHLFDFADFSVMDGRSETRGRRSVAIQKIDLECADLAVTINSVFGTADAKKANRNDGITRLSHVGAVQLKNGSQSGGAVGNTLSQLRNCLSFVAGKRTSPVCPVGFNENSKVVWRQWSSPSQTVGSTHSWFSRVHAKQLELFFACFMDKNRDKTWTKALHEAIYWYLNANQSSRGTDAGIILTQAALELLAYTYVVTDQKLLTAKGFKDLRASDKIRLLIGSIGIPAAIPSECGDITSVLASNNQIQWEDLPHALTEIRNSLVHPDAKNRDLVSTCYYDAWQAGLWYLELCILRICSYNGTYRNRLRNLRVGEVDAVPWT